MKFLLVSPFTDASGSSVRFWNIAESLRDRGHTVVYIDRRSRAGNRLHRSSDIRYYSCSSCGIVPLDILFSCFFNMVLFLRYRDSDVFYALKPAPNNCSVALLARLCGKKIICDVDDLDWAYLKPGAARTILHKLFDFFPRLFHLVTFHTPNLHDYLLQTARVPESRLYYLAQGISPAFLEELPERGASEETAELLYVATLGITSDFEDLIPALRTFFSSHSGVRMDIAGDGTRRGEFERRIAEAGIASNVRFVGIIDHRELPAFVAAHRIGINYMRDSEVNRCRAILKIREYLACGLEVVCNDVGDAALFDGYIHIEPTISALFATVETLLSNPPHRNTEARAFIGTKYRWSDIVGAFCERVEQQ